MRSCQRTFNPPGPKRSGRSREFLGLAGRPSSPRKRHMLDFLNRALTVDTYTLVVVAMLSGWAGVLTLHVLSRTVLALVFVPGFVLGALIMNYVFELAGILPDPRSRNQRRHRLHRGPDHLAVRAARVPARVCGRERLAARAAPVQARLISTRRRRRRGCGKDHFAMHRRLWVLYGNSRTQPRLTLCAKARAGPIGRPIARGLFRTYAGHSTAAKSNELYRNNLAKGQTGLSIAFDLPTQTGYDSDDELAKGEVGKVGVPVSHLGDMRTLLDGIPLDQMNTSMTINATAAWLLSLYVAYRRRAGRLARQAHRHHPERHHQGIPVARHLRVSARAVAAADQGHDRLLLPRSSEVEPDQRLLLPSAGSGRDAGAGAGLRAGNGDRRARYGEGVGRGAARAVRHGRRARLVLRQRGSAVHHRDLQDARVQRAVGRDHPRALRRDQPEGPHVPLRRAGEQPRPHRAAAGEQRLPHPHRDARRDAVEEGARARRAASRLERGARPAAPVGPAVVAAHAADPGLRDRPARVRRHLRRLDRDRQQGRRVEGAGQGRARRPSRRWAAPWRPSTT